MKNGTHIKKKWMQFKVSALSASITALIVSSIPTQISASDIDIYQSGGTGAINIYFMTDTSGSMGNSSLSDYEHTSSKNVCKMETQKKYKQYKKGDYRLTFNDVGVGKGDYNLSNKVYVFVGQNQGRYELNRVRDIKDNTSDIDRYSEDGTYSNEVCAVPQICNSYETLPSSLTTNGYVYVEKGESYCRVNSSDLDLNNTLDNTYYNKILCTRQIS